MSDTQQDEKKFSLTAFEKIRAAAEGNTIEPTKVELLGSDETTLTIKAEMRMHLEMTREKANYTGAFKNVKGVAKGRVFKVAAGQAEEKIQELKTQATTGNYWCKDAAKQLKDEPHQGWGLEKADIILDSMAQVYYTETLCTGCNGTAYVNCSYCRGAGYLPCSFCRETGFEMCNSCNGSGFSSNSQEQYCSYCNGQRQVHCRECRGQRQMQCNPCRGQGKTKCNTCQGTGSFTQEEYVVPTAKAEFNIIESGDLPGGFRRAISRAGTKSLAKGHATITVLDLVEPEKGDPMIPYQAVLPFAEMRVRINGKPMKCSVMGHKGVILDLPAFLDTAIEPHIKAFEENIRMADTLSKALKIRVFREAYGLLQMNRADGKSLRQLYAAGLSLEMAERILVTMRKLVHGQTITTRIFAAFVVLIILAGIDYGIISTGVRAAIASTAKLAAVFMFDIITCAGGFILVNILLRYAAAKKLQKQLGEAGSLRAQSAGGVGVVTGVLAMAIYVIMLFLLKAEPLWKTILAHPF